MAVDAPLHQQRVGLEHQRHLIHATMTGRTAYALIHMNAVVEIHEIGKAVNLDPLDGFTRAVAFAHRLQIVRILEEDGMAVHAGFRGRDTWKSGGLHAGMAIPAIDSIVSDMMFVAELHWLFARDVLAGHIRRTRRPKYRQNSKPPHKNIREDTKTRDEVGASMKNLGHVRFFALWRGAR